MGYRSEVGLMVIRDDKEAPSIPEVLAMAKAKGILADDTFDKYYDGNDYGWDDDRFLLYLEWTKWYESFPEVKAIMDLYAFFEELNRDEEGEERKWFSGRYVRCGEESNDNEETAFGDGWDIQSIGFMRRVYVEDQLGLLGNQNKLSGVNKESEHA